MNKNKNSFEFSEIIIKTLTKKISYIVIFISFLLGLIAFTKREIKYELSSEFIFNKFGIEERLVCKYSNFDCFKDFSRLSNIFDLAYKELIEKKDSKYFYALSVKDKSINVLTRKKESVELFKESLINIENSLIDKVKNYLNNFFQTLEENKLNHKGQDRDLYIYEYKSNSIQNHIIKGGKILIFKEPKVKEISKGYELIFIFIFIGLITSLLITLKKEKLL